MFLRFLNINTHYKMLKIERQVLIMKQIHLHNRVLSSDLSDLLEVSEDTIRRDLNEMHDSRQLVKVHGGALSLQYHFDYPRNNIYAVSEKQVIAQKTVALIKPNSMVLLGGGTTINELVQVLPQNLKATFFTTSLMTALQLCNHPTAEVVYLGGQINKSSGSSVGGEVVSRLSEINIDLCIMGTNGIDANFGITEDDIEVTQLKKAMIKASKETAIMSISEKLGTQKPLRVCGLESVTYLITELKPESKVLLPYQKFDLKLI